tara:strand:+ start:538 stop:1170 length:633 start_codon:yes stop_codon:yes gene_type:complete
MKRIGITQRAEFIDTSGETRDALDTRWTQLLPEIDLLPVPLPNQRPDLIPVYVNELKLEGFLLTGGEDLSYLNPASRDKLSARDEFEYALISYAVENEMPLFGVCRGMQVINYYFGGKLEEVEGHVAVSHTIVPLVEDIPLSSTVNSFHRWTVPSNGLPTTFIPLAEDQEGNIEAYIHKSKNIAGIIWHPERNQKFNIQDLNFIKRILNG